MNKVRWLAARETHRRVLTAADFTSLGVDHAQDETFSMENDFTVQMEDQACETLVERLPNEFVILSAPEEYPVATKTKPVGTGGGSSPASVAPDQEDPNSVSSASVIDDDDEDDEASSRPRRKR